MSRITNNVASGINTTHTQTSAQPQNVKQPPVAEQIQQTLFGRITPRQLNIADFPDLAAIIRFLNRCRKKLATLHGDPETDYEIVLADGTIAAIDKDGKIFVGAGFLMAYAHEPSVLVGALAHEIGHRPKRWKEPKYQMRKELTPQDIQAICREEETRADIFAGKGLAELGFDCEPLIDFLKRVQVKPHPDYFSAEVRGDVIREAFGGRDYSVKQRQKLFPGYERYKAARGHVGDG